jgi:hypothetical protein
MRIKSALALVAAATLAVSACGGGGGGADAETVAQLRESASDSELFAVLSEGEQDCLFETIAENDDLTQAILSEAEPTDAQLAEVFGIMAECAPDALVDVLAQDDPQAAEIFGQMSTDELQCVVDEIATNPGLLSGDEEALGLVLFECAPTIGAGLFATELGIETEQAECLIEELGGFEALVALEDPDTDASAISELFAAFEACGIDITTLG